MKFILTSSLLMLLLISTAIAAAERPMPPTPNPSALSSGLNVLVIGDSNTEIGHITGGLAQRFEKQFGYFGSGYRSLNATIGMGSGYQPYLQIVNDAQWESYTMLWPTAAAKPYLAPEGTGIRSRLSGATATIEFVGDAIEVFWLADTTPGGFTASVDGAATQSVNTQTASRSVQKTVIENLKNGWHTLTLVATTPAVMLLGVSSRVSTANQGKRAVVHKWGKGWATTKDFLDVDAQVFASALQAIQPDVTVIMLGTNDHNLAGNNRDQFAEYLSGIVTRVKTAQPNTRVLVLSTFQINSPWSNNGLKEYLGILPELCRNLGVSYWDMSTWFGGPWEKNHAAGWMGDDFHVNQAGGERIASQLSTEILSVAKLPAGGAEAVKPATGHLVGKSVGNAVGKDAAALRLDGLSAWWRADGQLEVDDAGRVLRWLDARGSGPEAAAPWLSSRPLLVAETAHDRPVLRFDGKASYLRFPLLAEARTIIVVLRSPRLILGHPYFNARPFHPGATRPDKQFSSQYAAPEVTGGKAYLNGREVHLADDRDDAAVLDDKHLQVLTLGLAGPVPFSYLGWGGSWNFNYYLEGDVAEIAVYNRLLSDDERQRIEADEVTRWGITAAAPAVRKSSP